MEKRDMLRQKLESHFPLFSMGKESPAIEVHATLQEEASCCRKPFLSLWCVMIRMSKVGWRCH